MTVLRQPPGRVRKGCAGGDGSEPPCAELAGEQVGAEEGERVREEEERVVDDERGVRVALCREAGRCVADQRVREGQAVGERPEDVRLEEMERLVQHGVADPRDLPGLEERVAEVGEMTSPCEG